MPRPIRDIPPNVAYSGDAGRAYGRVDKGFDWLAKGNAAVKRGLDAWADYAAQRLQQVRELEDEVALQRADADFRLRLGEAVRSLDPAAEDYQQKVAEAFNSVFEAVRRDTSFPGNRVAERFAARAESIRTLTLLQAADARERAVVTLARQAAQEEINRAAAAVASGAGYDVTIAAAMERLSGLLSRMDTTDRQQIERSLQESVGTTYAKTLIGRRDFRGAEAALRDLGGRGVLSPTAVNTLRAGLIQERRNAESEARAAAMERYQMASVLVNAFIAEAQQMTPEEAREQATRLQPQIDAAIAAAGGRNSPRGLTLALAWERAVARASNRYALEFNELVSRFEMGEELSAQDETRLLDIRRLRARNEAVIPSDATPEKAEEIRRREGERAVRNTQLRMAVRQVRVPVRSLVAEAAQASTPQQIAELTDIIRHIVQANPGAEESNPTVREMFKANPALEAAYRTVQARGQLTTGQNVAAQFGSMPRIEPRVAKELGEVFDSLYPTTGEKAANTTRTLNRAIKAAGVREPDHLIRQQVLARARTLVTSAGVNPEEAIKLAAEGYARSTTPQVIFSTSSWEGQAPRVPAEQAVLSYVPPNIRDRFGPETLQNAVREALKTATLEEVRRRGLKETDSYAVIPTIRQENGRPLMSILIQLGTGVTMPLVDPDTGRILSFNLNEENVWTLLFGLTEARRREMEDRVRQQLQSPSGQPRTMSARGKAERLRRQQGSAASTAKPDVAETEE